MARAAHNHSSSINRLIVLVKGFNFQWIDWFLIDFQDDLAEAVFFTLTVPTESVVLRCASGFIRRRVTFPVTARPTWRREADNASTSFFISSSALSPPVCALCLCSLPHSSPPLFPLALFSSSRPCFITGASVISLDIKKYTSTEQLWAIKKNRFSPGAPAGAARVDAWRWDEEEASEEARAAAARPKALSCNQRRAACTLHSNAGLKTDWAFWKARCHIKNKVFAKKTSSKTIIRDKNQEAEPHTLLLLARSPAHDERIRHFVNAGEASRLKRRK